MHELLAWHDSTLYVNGWLLIGLVAGVFVGPGIAWGIVREWMRDL